MTALDIQKLPELESYGCRKSDGNLFLSFSNWYTYFGRRYNMPRKEALQLGFQLRNEGVVRHLPAHGWLIITAGNRQTNIKLEKEMSIHDEKRPAAIPA